VQAGLSFLKPVRVSRREAGRNIIVFKRGNVENAACQQERFLYASGELEEGEGVSESSA
jgi:hypothetical protein